MSDVTGQREFVHKIQVPILSVFISLASLYIMVSVAGLTPPGWLFITDMVWTSFLSPVLAWSYPVTAYMIQTDQGQKCVSVTEMIRHSEQYTTMDFIQQITYKENRFNAPLVLLLSIFTASVSSYWNARSPGTFGYDNRLFRAGEQIISWAELPLVWLSWLFMWPNYIFTTAVNMYFLAVYYVMVRNGVVQVAYLEKYLYDVVGASCIVENNKCNEIWLRYDRATGECYHACLDSDSVYDFDTMTCIKC